MLVVSPSGGALQGGNTAQAKEVTLRALTGRHQRGNIHPAMHVLAGVLVDTRVHGGAAEPVKHTTATGDKEGHTQQPKREHGQ